MNLAKPRQHQNIKRALTLLMLTLAVVGNEAVSLHQDRGLSVIDGIHYGLGAPAVG